MFIVRTIIIIVLGLLPFCMTAQGERPSYCDDLPVSYDATIKGAGVKPPPSLPKFGTTPTPCYKVQVAVLKFTDPKGYPFHPSLVARHRPCEDIWVVESRSTFATKAGAEAEKEKLRKLGYKEAYVVDMLGYE